MSTAFAVLRDIFALIGLTGCVLLAVLLALNAADSWTSRRRMRHLDEIERAEATRRAYLQRAVDRASGGHSGGAEL